MKSVSLACTEGKSNKVYNMQLQPAPKGDGFVVNFQFGPNGGTLQTGTKTKQPVALAQAEAIFDKIEAEKIAKGYHRNGTSAGVVAIAPETQKQRTSFPAELLEEISEAEAIRLAGDDRYLLQEKRDGHRRQLRASAGETVSYNRKGEAVPLPLAVAADASAIARSASFLMDGELEGEKFVAFDLLETDGKSIGKQPYSTRLEALRALVSSTIARHIHVVGSWDKRLDKLNAFKRLFTERAEGVVLKRADAPYRPGRNGQHKKFKFIKTLSARVLSVNKDKGKDSVSVGLYDDKRFQFGDPNWSAVQWIDVGTASIIGKRIPKVGDVVEVVYLYATEARRLYQGRLKGRDAIRTDVGPEACTISQLRFKQGVEQPIQPAKAAAASAASQPASAPTAAPKAVPASATGTTNGEGTRSFASLSASAHKAWATRRANNWVHPAKRTTATETPKAEPPKAEPVTATEAEKTGKRIERARAKYYASKPRFVPPAKAAKPAKKVAVKKSRPVKKSPAKSAKKAAKKSRR